MELTPRPNVRELAPERRSSPWAGLSTPPLTPESKAAGQLRRLRDTKAFPDEILLDLFDLVFAFTVTEDRCGYIPWLTNALSMGAVCSQWHRVMHGRPGPRLWRTIYVLPIRRPECLHWQLMKFRSSTTANLRLEIHVQPPDRTFDKSRKDEYLNNLKDLVSILADSTSGPSVFSRCKDIRIRGSVAEWTRVLSRLYPFLPALDTAVESFTAVCYTDTLTKAPKNCPFPLTQFPFPSTLRSFTLKFIPLTGISWDWTAFTSLRSLDLYFHVRDPNWPADNNVDVEALGNLDVLSMYLLLRSVSQTLTSLRLGRWWTEMVTPSGFETPPPVVLPHLTDLTVIWFNNENMLRLMKLFSAPNLRRALLQDIDTTEDSQWLSLPTFSESWSGLECLIIRLVNPALADTFALNRLLRPLTALRRLHVQFLHDTWEDFYRKHLRSALMDPSICPVLVRFTFGYESRSRDDRVFGAQSLSSSQAEADSQSQSENSYWQGVSSTDDWWIGTPTEPDSQPLQFDDDSDPFQMPHPHAEARLSRLNTLMSVMSEPDLANITAALEEMLLEEVPPFAALTRQSSMNVSFRTEGSAERGSQMSIDEVSHMLVDRQGSQMSIDVDAGTQTQLDEGSQESMDRPIHRSWVTDMELSIIVDDMAARRKLLPPNTLRATVIPLRNFSYDRYY